MQKYKVLEAFELDGVQQVVDAVVELSEEVAGPLLEQGKVALVEETV